jgi:4a-hydroxytetrahydrobiopterin dehydratase
MAPDTPEQARGRRATASRLAREDIAFLVDDMVGKLFPPHASAALRSEWREIMARTPREGAAAALRALADRPDSTDTLRNFRGPTLVITGRHDAIFPVAEAEAMASAAPNGRLEIIEGAGHMTAVEQPDRFATVLAEFLEATKEHAMEQLANMKCEACRADAPTLSEEEIERYRPEVPEWEVVERDGIPRLERVFEFRNFVQALEFTNHVGELAEQEGHHPAILTEWGKVTVTWWTHKIGGLHQNDFIMAAQADDLYDDSE